MKFTRTAIWLTALFCLLAASFWIPWQGAWVDRAASMFLSRTLGVSVRCHNVKVPAWPAGRRGWPMISFDSGEVAFAGKEARIHSGPGTIRFGGWRFLKGSPRTITIELRQVSLPESLYRRIPFSPLQALNAGQGSIMIDRLKLYVVQKKKQAVAHLLQLTSNEIEARGGIQYEDRRKVDKAHVVLFFQKAITEKLPESLQARVLSSQGGEGRIRFIFSGQTLIVIGVHGPLLKAQWG